MTNSAPTGIGPLIGPLTVPSDDQLVYRVLMNPRSRTLLLQILVSIIVSYEVLLGSNAMLNRWLGDGVVIALWFFIGVMACLPAAWLEAPYLTAGLVVIDTLLVTSTIYLSGNARSDLYMTYFVLMLAAVSVRRLSYRLALSLFLGAGYAVVLYESVPDSGVLSAGHLLGVPVLLIMGIFYGVVIESLAVEQVQKSELQREVESLQHTETRLATAKAQLEARVSALKEGLALAQAQLREGLAVRQGLERRLRDAQKMDALGRISSGIAQEFGSLFSVIGRHTGVLLSRMRPDDPLRETVEDLCKTGEQAATLTAELIALHADQTPMRQVVSMTKVLAELRPALEGLLPAGITLTIQTDGSPAYADLDREGVEKVICQLVVNARDAMPGGGDLQIDVAGVVSETGTRRGAEANGRAPSVLMTVRDSGIGMSMETQTRIFDPFFSTKDANCGLGLTTVYKIVQQHDGTVDIESRPGQGTVVRIIWPGVHSSSHEGGPLARRLLAKGEETVLVVDADEIVRTLAVSILERHRYHVLEASSPTEALLVAQRYEGCVNLAVSPLFMQDMAGKELARRLVGQHAVMKALFVSSYGEDTARHHRINEKCMLQHPYRQIQLVEKVREILDGV